MVRCEFPCCLKPNYVDLSFNNISKIEGLETLTRLNDLSLFSNQITTLEGMDTLVNLKVLSLGKNNIKNMDKVGRCFHLPRGYWII